MHNSANLLDLGPILGGLGQLPRTVELSVVIPTRNEAPNIAPLVEEIETVLAGISAELIFVDDSDDESAHVIRRHAPRARILHREPAERAGGLGTAVAAGFAAARGTWVAVMDADLQHPPEVLVELLHRARLGKADFVVASRYRPGGSTGDFGAGRELVSKASTTVAKLLFPLRLRAVTDPMSGFFLFRRAAVDVERLRPRGYKILLETIVRADSAAVAEVPYRFALRQAGQSKASLREGLRFLSHLVRLRLSGRAGRLVRFAVVGASGLAVNTAVLVGLTAGAGTSGEVR